MTTGRAVPAELGIIADFPAGRYLPCPRPLRQAAKVVPAPRFLDDTVDFPEHINNSMSKPHKNKTLAIFLALVLGGLGAHRFYLKGSADRLGLLHLCSVPIAGLVIGLAPQADGFYKILPLLVSYIVGFVEALVIGVTPDDKWDAAHNAGSGRSKSNWILGVLLVVTMLVGTTIMIATISRLFDLLYTGGAYG
jgi:hypothetical protein